MKILILYFDTYQYSILIFIFLLSLFDIIVVKKIYTFSYLNENIFWT